jgi:chlorobactene glucosyltransferase
MEKRGVPVRLIEGTEPPAGWIGKNHAIVQGVKHASGSWILFTDADTRHAPEALASAYAYAVQTRSALVSLTGDQEAEGVWEKILQPLVFRLLDAVYPLSGANGGNPKRAAANGTYMLVRRDAYDAIGGHAAVRGEVLEDVAIAQAITGAGYRASFLRGEHLLRVRMYQSSGSLWEGWTKNLWPLLGRNGRRTAMVTAAVLMAGPIPAAMLWYDGAAAWAAVVGAIGAEAWFRARGGSGPAWAISMPLGALLLAVMILESARRHLGSRGISWKGRTYPLLP